MLITKRAAMFMSVMTIMIAKIELSTEAFFD